jgi:hypothetical protein
MFIKYYLKYNLSEKYIKEYIKIALNYKRFNIAKFLFQIIKDKNYICEYITSKWSISNDNLFYILNKLDINIEFMTQHNILLNTLSRLINIKRYEIFEKILITNNYDYHLIDWTFSNQILFENKSSTLFSRLLCVPDGYDMIIFLFEYGVDFKKIIICDTLEYILNCLFTKINSYDTNIKNEKYNKQFTIYQYILHYIPEETIHLSEENIKYIIKSENIYLINYFINKNMLLSSLLSIN